VTPEREVSFTHWSGSDKRPAAYHIVQFELDAVDNGTKVTATQCNVGPAPDVDGKTKAEFTKTFGIMLEALRQAVEVPKG